MGVFVIVYWCIVGSWCIILAVFDIVDSIICVLFRIMCYYFNWVSGVGIILYFFLYCCVFLVLVKLCLLVVLMLILVWSVSYVVSTMSALVSFLVENMFFIEFLVLFCFDCFLYVMIFSVFGCMCCLYLFCYCLMMAFG